MVNHPWEYHLDTTPLFLTDPSNSHLLLWNYFNRRHFFFYFIFFTHPCMGLCFTVLIIHYAFFPHISTMRLYISTKLVLHNYISYASSSYTLKNLQVKINTWAYHRTHFTLPITQNLTMDCCFSKIVESQSKWMY